MGTYPQTGKHILAGIRCCGPQLKHGAAYVALPEDEDVLAVGLNRAVMLVDTGALGIAGGRIQRGNFLASSPQSSRYSGQTRTIYS